MPKKFLTVTEVARIMGVTPLTVRNWDKAGRLLAYRNPFNNYRMYKVEDVEMILKKIDGTKGMSPLNSSSNSSSFEKPKVRKLKIEVE